MNSLSANIANICAGIGYGYLPRSAVSAYIAQGLMREYEVYDPYRCTKCRACFTEEVPFKYRGTRITRRAAGWVRELLRGRLAIKAVQEITGIHWDTVHRIHKEMMEEALESRAEELRKAKYKPTRLAVDEFAIHKGHTYATCVMDLDTGEVIWAGKGRSKEDFKRFFEDMPEGYLSDVVAVAMDMNASYNILFTEKLPKAVIVYDRYHMQAQYSKEVLGAVRLTSRHSGSVCRWLRL